MDNKSIRDHLLIQAYGQKGISLMNILSVFLFFFFYVMNILVRGMNLTQDAFYSTLAIAVPFENNALIFSRLIFNYAIIMVFVFTIIHHLSQLFSMSSYILPRMSRTYMFWLFFERTCKKTLWIVLIKLLADLFAGQINALENVNLLLLLYVSFVLTIILWILIIFILYTLNIGEQKTLFLVLSFLFVCQYLSFHPNLLNIFVVANPSILSDFVQWGVRKVGTALLLLFISSILFKHKEFIGAEKE